jgi:hypothetical protein
MISVYALCTGYIELDREGSSSSTPAFTARRGWILSAASAPSASSASP